MYSYSIAQRLFCLGFVHAIVYGHATTFNKKILFHDFRERIQGIERVKHPLGGTGRLPLDQGRDQGFSLVPGGSN